MPSESGAHGSIPKQAEFDQYGSWTCPTPGCRRFVPKSRQNCPWCGSGRPSRGDSARGASRDIAPAKKATLAGAAVVLMGFADLPYGFYMLLRLFLCGISLFIGFGANLALEDWHRWLLVGIAVLYNPLLPIQLGDKGLWEILNVATIVVFWALSGRQPSA